MTDDRTTGSESSPVERALARVARIEASSTADVAPDDAMLDALTALETAVAEHDRAPLAGIRDLATPTRTLLAIGSALLAIVGFGFSACRNDIGPDTMTRFVAEVGLLTVALVTTLMLALRPMWRPALPRTATVAWILATLGVAVVIALVPGPAEPMDAAVHGMGTVELGPLSPRHWAAGLPCLSIGLFVGIPIYLLARLFDRGQRASAWLGAAAAGVASNLALALHCPSGDVAHKLGSHASLGFIFLGCLGVAAVIESLLPRLPHRGARR